MGTEPILDLSVVTEETPGESDRGKPPAVVAALWPVRAVAVAVLAILTLPLWPVYLLLRLIYGHPPNVVRLADVPRYLRAAWTERPPPPGLLLTTRAWLTLSILRRTATIPLWGTAWLLDEVLYGRKLRETPVEAPLLEVSAARSGSTQLAHYLEEDPNLVSPTFLQCLFPFMWLWRLAPKTIGKVMTPEKVRKFTSENAPREFIERHEGDPFKMETFEVVFMMARLSTQAVLLGPEFGLPEFATERIRPASAKMWTEDFPNFVDRIGRKTLVHAGVTPGDGRRLFIKGHFLCAVDILAERYPDAAFLTVIREPGPRFRSAANFLRANEFDPVLPPFPWSWVSQAVIDTQIDYCEREMEWFTRPDGPRRCVVRFSEYCRDLSGTLEKIYDECLDSEVPSSAPVEHAERERSNYSVNRTLAELGIDEEALNERLADYVAWCRGEAAATASSISRSSSSSSE